jgi:hypothetical protein
VSIKTDITQQDYTAYLTHVSRTLSISKLSTFMSCLRLAIALGLGFSFVMMKSSAPSSVPMVMLNGVLAGGLLMLLLVTIISRWQVQRMQPVDDGLIVGSQEVFLEDEGIRQRSAHHQSVYQWSLVRSITVTEQHVFVMLDSVAGLILPRRSFSSDTERESFVSEMERRSGKVRS